MSIAEDINNEYGNILDAYNPVLKNALELFEESGLLDYLSEARKHREPTDTSIKTFKDINGNPNEAAPLEIFVDVLTRTILKSYQEGFTQGVFTQRDLKSDGASNIGFKTQIPEDLELLKVDMKLTTNVHEALIILAKEINQIKVGLVGLGVNIPNAIPTPSLPASIK